jgi:hypothetical protein
MKNNRIVKTLQWGIGGMLILLLGLGTILLPLGTNTVHAANVQIRDDARVLDVDQVRSQASQLSHSVSISTMRTFSGPKSDFIRSTEQALTGQNAIAIAIGIAVEQRYLAIVAGKQAGLNAEQIEQARQAFAKAYGSNAGANGNNTGATLAALQSLQAGLGNEGILSPLPTLGRVLGNPLTWLLLLALIGGAFFVFRRFSGQRNRMNPPMGMPWQERPGPKDAYGRVDSDAGYGQPGYSGPMYGPPYPPQRGMNPWAAGGLGAVGGGLLGYGLGRMAGEHEQPQGNDSMNPDAITPLSQGGDDPGMNDPADTFGEGPDFGGFSGEGADFGGGDFGGGSDW